LHGGIGFTWEHDCHLFFKRAKLNQTLGGDTAVQKDRIAQQLFG
jgi:alkylation response protein AidB-like acyl-CoA dehydrogenase